MPPSCLTKTKLVLVMCFYKRGFNPYCYENSIEIFTLKMVIWSCGVFMSPKRGIRALSLRLLTLQFTNFRPFRGEKTSFSGIPPIGAIWRKTVFRNSFWTSSKLCVEYICAEAIKRNMNKFNHILFLLSFHSLGSQQIMRERFIAVAALT